MSIDTPSTAGRPVPENVNGILVVCRYRTRPRASVIGSSRTTLGLAAPDHLEVVLAEVPHLLLRPREVRVGAARQPVHRRAVGVGHRPVREEEAALLVLREDEVRHEVDDLAEPRLGVAQGLVGLPQRRVMSTAIPTVPRMAPARVAQRLDVRR